jgi:NodT family efflux transporter outer membrane factor (OMF) lipoprotein
MICKHLVTYLVVVCTMPLFLLGGCATVGPDYAPPEVETPARWNAALPGKGQNNSMSGQSLDRWWECLNDPLLSDLIKRAIGNNNDIKEALARVREVRARKRITGADRWPTIDASLSERTGKSSNTLGGGTSRDLYTAGFDAGWEIDMFGGVRRSVEAATAELDASVYSYADVQISLVAETALTYSEMQTYEIRLDVAEKNLSLQSQTLDLTRARFEAGLVTAIDVSQAKTNLEVLHAGIPGLKAGRQQSRNRLAVLLGMFPDDLDDILTKPRFLPAPPVDIAVGIPAAVLLKRPDVRRAERNLAAQTAKIGVAKAQSYPKLTLSGSIGLEALSPGDLLSTDAQNHGFGPSFSWRIFDAGALRRSVAAQEAVSDQAYFQYQSTVLTALEEVENALTAFAAEQQRLASLTRAKQSAAEAFELSRNRYSSGLIDFQSLLETQKSLFSVEDNVAQSHGAVVTDLIRLYKALGGGWTAEKPF